MGKHVFLLVLSFCSIVNAGSGGHSLYVLATYITGETPYPEFTAVLMLDDVQVGYFDSKSDNLVCSGHDANNKKIDTCQEPINMFRTIYRNIIFEEPVDSFRNIYYSMRERLIGLKHHFNLTGINVQQRIAGCEMLDGEPTLIMFKDACNGIDADGLFYHMTGYLYSTTNQWQLGLDKWSEVKLTYNKVLLKMFSPICAKLLKYHLEREKSVLRRVPPRLRFLEKVVPGGAQLSCLATDFYPRHINLTLLRDGQPVEDQELTGGAVLPNGNGLYQVRKTLEISTQELRERHKYTCSASHLSLDNKLDISWQPEFSREHRVSILLSSGGAMLIVLVILIVFSICLKRRRRADSRTTLQPANVDAEATEGEFVHSLLL